MINLLKLYHRLPYPLKVLAASGRGAYLRAWRYGPDHERLVAQALERESWSPERWQAWQEERLAFVLHRAATRIPYYRQYWQKQRRLGNHVSFESLDNWPVLKKEALRQNPGAFVADDCNLRRMYEEHTSGSTGKPLILWWSRQTVQKWYALFEARWRRWYGLSRFDRWAILGGQLVVPYSQKKPPYWVWNAGLKQLYLSAYHISEQAVPCYLEAIRRYGVKYILGYPSGITTLAKLALEQGLQIPKLSLVLSNAEPLYQHQREILARAFQAPVRDTYGMSEIVCAASECEAGQMHLWPEVGYTEVMADGEDEILPAGQTGRLICTGLLNTDMPLIRYEVGDRGALENEKSKCHCGRNLPILSAIEGRLDDSIITPDGRKIGRLDPVLKADLAIREAQIVQESLQKLCFKVVPAQKFSQREEIEIAKRLKERVGEMQIRVELVESIPRSANGKVKFVISKVNVE